jgi:hypothetical protein
MLLRDKNKVIILPQTHASLVLTSTSNVEEELTSLKNDVNTALSRFVGGYDDLAALELAYPTASLGQWAIIDVEGEEPDRYDWDVNDTSWVKTGGINGINNVNGKTGASITLAGGDINSLLDIDGTPTTQTITQWLQALRDDINTVTADAINATVDAETKSVESFLQDLTDNTKKILPDGTDLRTIDDGSYLLKEDFTYTNDIYMGIRPRDGWIRKSSNVFLSSVKIYITAWLNPKDYYEVGNDDHTMTYIFTSNYSAGTWSDYTPVHYTYNEVGHSDLTWETFGSGDTDYRNKLNLSDTFLQRIDDLETDNYLPANTDIVAAAADSANWGKTFYLDPNVAYINEPLWFYKRLEEEGYPYSNFQFAAKVSYGTYTIFGNLVRIYYEANTFYNYSFPNATTHNSTNYYYPKMVATYDLTTGSASIKNDLLGFIDLSHFSVPDIWVNDEVVKVDNDSIKLSTAAKGISVNEDWVFANTKIKNNLDQYDLKNNQHITDNGVNLDYIKLTSEWSNSTPLLQDDTLYNGTGALDINQGFDIGIITSRYFPLPYIQNVVISSGGVFNDRFNTITFEGKNIEGQVILTHDGDVNTNAVDNGNGTITQTTNIVIEDGSIIYTISEHIITFEVDTYNITNETKQIFLTELPYFTDFLELETLKAITIESNGFEDLVLFTGERERIYPKTIAYKEYIDWSIRTIDARSIQDRLLSGITANDINRIVRFENKLYEIYMEEQEVIKYTAGIEFPETITFDTTATPQIEYSSSSAFIESMIDIYDSSLEEPVRSIYMWCRFTGGDETNYTWYLQDGETTTNIYNNTGWLVSSYNFNIPAGGKAEVNSNLGEDGNNILYYVGSLINETPTTLEDVASTRQLTTIDDGPKPTPAITLLSANWVVKDYTLDLTGTVLEGLDNQLYDITSPVIQNMIDYGLYIKSATLNEIVISCQSDAPTTDIDINILYQTEGGN